MSDLQRRLLLEGAINVRDLGGCRSMGGRLVCRTRLSNRRACGLSVMFKQEWDMLQ